jgi:hypothetical protein
VSERMKRCDSETAETRMSVGEMTRERESMYESMSEGEYERARERVLIKGAEPSVETVVE